MRAGLTAAQFPFFARLTEAARRELGTLAATGVAPAAHLLRRGDDAGGAYLVTAGSLRVFYISDDGREATLYRVEPGGTCVLSLTDHSERDRLRTRHRPGGRFSGPQVAGATEAGGNRANARAHP